MLIPNKLGRQDRLSIDDGGIHFDCHYWPHKSWSVVWNDIQPPITHTLAALYIPCRQSGVNKSQSESDWHRHMPNHPVFMLDRVSVWRAVDEAADEVAGGDFTVVDDETARKASKRPTVIGEIERRLGQAAIKKVFLPSRALTNQARETLLSRRPLQARAYDLDPVAQGLLAGAVLIALFGLFSCVSWANDAYLLNAPLTFYVLVALLITIISLWPLRHRKNTWATSAVVALLCGGAFGWTLFNGAQFWAAYWGEQEARTFTLRESLPSDRKPGERQIWLSDKSEGEGRGEGASDAEQPALELKIPSGLARQPHQSGDQIKLLVRRGLFGQYLLNIDEAGAHFKKRLN
ncbi:MAG: hypothetical protein LBB65_01595 [Burkholderiales bacterium]|nr:hypothetical protein [Burkholderiales bacterium]